MSKTDMHWNHRLVRVKEGKDTILMLCEVFYNGDGVAIGRNEGARIFGEDVAECRSQLERMQRALERRPLDDHWPQKGGDQ